MVIIQSKDKENLVKCVIIKSITQNNYDSCIFGYSTAITNKHSHILGSYSHKRCKEIIEDISKHINEYSMLKVFIMPEK